MLGWWSSERLGWVLAAVLWWVQIGVEVQIGVARVVGFGCGFVAVLWWVLAVVCAVVFFFGGWGLRLWLVVVAVAVAVVRGDELEKLRPWMF